MRVVPRGLRVLFTAAVVFLLIGGLAGADRALQPAILLYEARQYSQARAMFLAVEAERGATDPELDFYLGRLALWFDDQPDALSRLERAVACTPQAARLHNALGDAYGLAAQNAGWLAKLGWARKCLAAYECASRLEPNNPAYRWSLLGYHLVAPRIAGGGREKALAQAEAIKQLDAMAGRVAYATVWLAERNPSEAFAQFDEVVRTHPDDFLALYHIGRCAALSGEQLERGRQALRRCLELRPPVGDGMPTVESVHHRLGNILEKLGDISGARRAYATALASNPDFRPDKIALKN